MPGRAVYLRELTDRIVTGARSIAYAEGVSLDWNRGALAAGLACYRNEEFFAAHEHWESVWLKLNGQEKIFLQALIQVTAAFHHLRRGNYVGTLALLRNALQRLENCPESFIGLNLTTLPLEILEWVRRLESGETPLPAAFPRICPLDLPPE